MDPYTLVAVLGTSPAVLTETVWSLAQEKRAPTDVHVLTTAVGADRALQELLTPLAPGAPSRWEDLCGRELALDATVPVKVHIAQDRYGVPLPDIRDATADLQFGALCYETVQALTASRDAPPVVGSVAGGRRSMGVHLSTAFSLWARPADTLAHVLVHPAEYERRPVYWPTEDTPDLRVDRVDLPFPRVRGVLESHRFSRELGGRTGLPALLDVLADYNIRGTPASVRLWLAAEDGGRSRIEILSTAGNRLGRAATATTRTVSLFLLLADETERVRRAHGGARGAVALSDLGSPPSGPLIDNPTVRARLSAVHHWCREDTLPDSLGDWRIPDDVSRAVGRLRGKEGLMAVGVPRLIRERLRFKGSSGRALHAQGFRGVEPDTRRYWHWPGAPLPVTVVAPPEGLRDAGDDAWPFAHIPKPAPYIEAIVTDR